MEAMMQEHAAETQLNAQLQPEQARLTELSDVMSVRTPLACFHGDAASTVIWSKWFSTPEACVPLTA